MRRPALTGLRVRLLLGLLLLLRCMTQRDAHSFMYEAADIAVM